MFCTACGLSLNDDHRYCSRCGKPVNDGQFQWNAAFAPRPAVPPARLERDMYDSKIAGVCSGWARYLGMDVTLMRLLWVLITFFTGVGLLAYPICWMVMPRNDMRPMMGTAYQS